MKAQRLGATILNAKTRGPAGEFSVVREPGGAAIALWQTRRKRGSSPSHAMRTVIVPDAPRARTCTANARGACADQPWVRVAFGEPEVARGWKDDLLSFAMRAFFAAIIAPRRRTVDFTDPPSSNC